MSSISAMCRFPGCKESILQWKLMCNGHWRLVPTVIQRRVFATLSVYKERGTEAARAQYQHAVDDAIQSVRVALDKRKAASS
jgi:hypothetical protein